MDGSAVENDTATVTIEDRPYTYTVKKGDTLDIIRDRLVELINQDPVVSATAAGVFDRIVIHARVQGPVGNDIPIGASSNTGGSVIMTPLTPKLCCANVEGSLVTNENPAIPGEVLVVYATGLGLPIFTDANKPLVNTGVQYPQGGPETQPVQSHELDSSCCFVSSLAGGKTADVLSATLQPGTVGTYRVVLHLNSDIPTNPATPVTIAQTVNVSNIVTFPVVNLSDGGSGAIPSSVGGGAIPGSVGGGTIPGSDGTGGPAPVFTAASVVNGATFLSGLTPGSLATVFASGIKGQPGIASAGTLPLPTAVGGVSVTVNGVAAPIHAIANVNGQQQVNFQVPFEIRGRTTADVVVTRNGAASVATNVPVVDLQPGIFSGVLVHNADFSLVTDERPLVPGEFAFLYAAGLGAVTNQPATGTAGPSLPLAETTQRVQVTIGGIPCDVQFAGLAPGFAGVYQVNFRVPANPPSGSQDVAISVGSATSPSVRAPVR